MLQVVNGQHSGSSALTGIHVSAQPSEQQPPAQQQASLWSTAAGAQQCKSLFSSMQGPQLQRARPCCPHWSAAQHDDLCVAGGVDVPVVPQPMLLDSSWLQIEADVQQILAELPLPSG